MPSHPSFRNLCGLNLHTYFTILPQKDKIAKPLLTFYTDVYPCSHWGQCSWPVLLLDGFICFLPTPPCTSDTPLVTCHSSSPCIHAYKGFPQRYQAASLIYQSRKQGIWMSALNSSQDLYRVQAYFNSSRFFPVLYFPCGVNQRTQKTQMLMPSRLLKDTVSLPNY